MPRLRLAVLALSAVGLWIALLRLPSLVAGSGFDDAWLLAFAFFLKHSAQAGRDYVFTYGPLGYFMQRTYDGDLFAAKYAWEIVVKGIFTAIALGCLSRHASWIARGALYLALLAFPAAADDAQYTLMVLLLGGLLLGRPRTPSLVLIGSALLLAVLALAKFTLLLVGGLLVVLLAVDLAACGERRKAAGVAGAFSVGILGAWTLAGQSLGGVPEYLRNSWEMSSGYTDAMSLDGSPWELLAGALVLVLWGTTLVAPRLRPGSRRSSSLALTLVGFVAYLTWKHGFVRHDMHATDFFALTLPATLALPVILEGFDWRARRRVLALGAAAVLSAVCLAMVIQRQDHPDGVWPSPAFNLTAGARGLFQPRKLRSRLEARHRFLEDRLELPPLRKLAGDATVDVFGNLQGVAILNRMNWRPRPSFQSYAAYTERLAEQNAAFLEGPRAPRFVLLNLTTLDHHLPSLEDGQALQSILARYRPVAADGGFLMLERGEQGARGGETRGEMREVRIGQVVILEGGDRPQILRVEIEKSWLGKLASVVLKPPMVELIIETDGQRRPYRLIPSLARSGFLINPLLLKTEDVIDAYADGVPHRRVTRCAVSTTDWGRRCYASVRVELDSPQALTGSRIGAEEARLLKAQFPHRRDSQRRP